MTAETLQTEADRVRALLLTIDRPPWRRTRDLIQPLHRAYIAVREGHSDAELDACANELAALSAKLETMPRRYEPPALTHLKDDDPRIATFGRPEVT